MNDTMQKQLGATLWKIADQLRGAMNADDFRDYMLLENSVQKGARSAPKKRPLKERNPVYYVNLG